jgi:hypothetical protein
MTAAVSSSLSSWEMLADWGTLLVIIGVAGEGIELALKILDRKSKSERFKNWYKRHEFSIEICGVIFWMMVVVGLVMEFRGNHKSQQIVKVENTRITEEAGEARKLAARAELDAGKANERASTNELIALGLAKDVLRQAQQIQDAAKIAIETRDIVGDSNTTARISEVKQAAADASKVAADVRSIMNNSNLASLKISSGDRTISPEQEKTLTDLLTPFVKANLMLNKTVQIGTAMSLEFEPNAYAKRIGSILKKCGFDVKMDAPALGFRDPNNLTADPLGLDITSNGFSPPPTMGLLINAFDEAKVPIRLATMFTNAPQDGIIKITVWHKP